MKLHILIHLFRAIIVAMSVTTLTCIECTRADSSYTTVIVNDLSDIDDAIVGDYKYILNSDLSGSIYYGQQGSDIVISSTSSNYTPLYGAIFESSSSSYTNPRFNVKNLGLDSLKNISFKNYKTAPRKVEVSDTQYLSASASGELSACGAIQVDGFYITNVDEVINITSNVAYAEVSATAKNTSYLFSGTEAIAKANTKAQGGFVYATNNIEITGNSAVMEISGNKANAVSSASASCSWAYDLASAYATCVAQAQGGAMSALVINVTGNTSAVSFASNSAITSTYANAYAYGTEKETETGYAYGGAIYGQTITISGNIGEFVFEKNSVRSQTTALGGAIYSTGSLSIVGNDSVSFEKNYEKVGSTYRLRSIYATGQLILAAKVGGHITFYDSVYASAAVSLNADYSDANGVTQKATGDIIFSGKYTEDHLKEVKGSAGTATEIANSRTSQLLNTVNLYGGTLRVEDKAVLKTYALNVTEGSNATLRISDGVVNAGTYNVAVNSTGTLELTGTEGSNKLTAQNVYIEKDGTLSVVNVVDPSEVITLAAAETVSVFNEKLGGTVSGSVYMEAGSTYKADGAHLSVQNGTLTFNATADEKINLVLTLQALYDEDSQVILFTDVSTVEFVWDDIIATTASDIITVNAADYFTGDWINENTSLVYDNGTVYVTGVNRVIPEPTTATLSLLALAALVSRRRRK